MSIQSNQEMVKNEQEQGDGGGTSDLRGYEGVGPRAELSTLGKRSNFDGFPMEEDQDELESNSKHDHGVSFNQEGQNRNSVLPLFSMLDNDHSRRNSHVFHHHRKQHQLSPHQSMFRNSENNDEKHESRSSRIFQGNLEEMEEGDGGENRNKEKEEMDSSTLDFGPFFNQVQKRKIRRKRLEERERISQTLMRYPDGIRSHSLLPSSKFISHLPEPHDTPSSTMDSTHKVWVDGHLFRVLSSDRVSEESDGLHLNELRLKHVSPKDSGEYICLSRHPPNSSGYTFQNAFLTLLTESKSMTPFLVFIACFPAFSY